MNFQNKSSSFEVDIFDSNYAMSYTLQYHITKDSIVVLKVDGLKNGNPIGLSQKKLNALTYNSIINLIRSTAFRHLKHKYKNALIDDGDQKKISITLDAKKKTIEIANIYNKEIAKLIANVNQVLEKEYKIKYTKE